VIGGMGGAWQWRCSGSGGSVGCRLFRAENGGGLCMLVCDLGNSTPWLPECDYLRGLPSFDPKVEEELKPCLKNGMDDPYCIFDFTLGDLCYCLNIDE